MKVVQINVVYPDGSTGNIVKELHHALIRQNNTSIVCYGRGLNVKEQNVYKIAPEFIMKLQSFLAKLTGYAYGGCFYSTRNLINILKRENPDIVHIHCINGYMVNIYKLLEYLKVNIVPTVLTLHAEFMYTAGCAHAINCEKWKTGCMKCPQRKKGRPASKIFDRSKQEWEFMRGAFEGFDNLVVTSVSEWLSDRAKQSPFFPDKNIKVIFNGIDTEKIFSPKQFDDLKKELNLNDEKIILHVTPNFKDPIKGGKYVLYLAEKFKKDNQKIKFIIVGYNGPKLDLPENVIVLPKIKNQIKLAKLYSMANITLLTSMRETFSMVCAESLSCGTPIVGFYAGGPEMIALKEYSKFVLYGDINGLEDAVLKWIDKKEIFSDNIFKEASKKYSQKLMCEKYIDIYNKINNFEGL